MRGGRGIDARPQGTTLSGVEWQSAMYADGLLMLLLGGQSSWQIGCLVLGWFVWLTTDSQMGEKWPIRGTQGNTGASVNWNKKGSTHVMKKIAAAALIAASASLALSACGSGAKEAAKAPSSTSSTTPYTPSTNDTTHEELVESTIEPEPEPTVEVKKSFRVGETALMGDWNVTVTKVTKPNTTQVKTWNMFNDASKNGQYVMADFTAKYVGHERTADSEWDLSWSFGGADGQVYDEASVVTPKDHADAPTEARPGGTIKGR